MAKSQKCKRCGKKAVQPASCCYLQFIPDDIITYSQDSFLAEDDVQIGGHLCLECGYMQDISILSPRNRIAK